VLPEPVPKKIHGHPRKDVARVACRSCTLAPAACRHAAGSGIRVDGSLDVSWIVSHNSQLDGSFDLVEGVMLALAEGAELGANVGAGVEVVPLPNHVDDGLFEDELGADAEGEVGPDAGVGGDGAE